MRLYLVMALATLFSFGCAKNEQKQTLVKAGWRPDDPIALSKVKLHVSPSFYRTMMMKGRPKPKPPKGDTTTTTPPPTDTTTPPPTDTVVVVTPPPSSIEFSLICPPVQNQIYSGPCGAFAACYARDIDWYYKNNLSSYSYLTNIFSPEFVYNLDIKKLKDADSVYYTSIYGPNIDWCSFGSSMTQNFDVLTQYGVCSWNTMPFNDYSCSTLPNSTQYAEALNYKISSYGGVYTSDIAGMKSILNQKKAIVFSIPLDNSFINAGAGYIWKSYVYGKTVGHIMAIVGYDDNKNAWKIINSWGTSWGDAGYGWIDYDFLAANSSGWGFFIN